MHPSVCALRRIHRPVCGARIARRALKHACALRPLHLLRLAFSAAGGARLRSPLQGRLCKRLPPKRLPCKGSWRRQPTEGCGAVPCPANILPNLRKAPRRAISPAAWGLRHRRVSGTMQASSRRRAWRKAGVYTLPPAPGRNAPKPGAAKQSGPQRKAVSASFEGRFLCCRAVCGQAALSWYIWQSHGAFDGSDTPQGALPRLPGRAAQPPCARRLRPRRQPISR